VKQGIGSSKKINKIDNPLAKLNKRNRKRWKLTKLEVKGML
jgi:hypothetical protein